MHAAASDLQALLTAVELLRQCRHLDLVGWLQTEPADMPSPLSLGLTLASRRTGRKSQAQPRNRRAVRPPRLDPEPGPGVLKLELLAPELRADLDSQRLVLAELDVDFEARNRDGVRPECAEADVHPLVLGIPAGLVHEAPLVERRVQLTVDGR
jgi:hypothetical protein